LKVKYTLLSTIEEDNTQTKKYGPMCPVPTIYGTVEIEGSIEYCENLKTLIETKYRIE
jgi:hypothetical protein